MNLTQKLNFENAVNYHYEGFPPSQMDYGKLIGPAIDAAAAIVRYDQMLKTMHNSEILLAPLRRQEAVISSRMEGTVSTLDEVLRYEADQEEGIESNNRFRKDDIETYLYSRALKKAQKSIAEGYPISEWLLRATHKELLFMGRGANLSPGEFKKEQNYIVDQTKKNVLFVPISPEKLNEGLEKLFSYIKDSPERALIKIAAGHVEFEALHPFKDGNGRIGRMLITLMLWDTKVISQPHFYVSNYLEENKDQYLDLMRDVSKKNHWTEWCCFFLEALEQQAIRNLKIAEEIRSLYEAMKKEFRGLLASQWHMSALDYIFANPVFRNSSFTRTSGIPTATAARFTRVLVENGLLITLQESSGRRAALYSFEPLLKIVRG